MNTWLGSKSAFASPVYREQYREGKKIVTVQLHGPYDACEAAVLVPDGSALVPGSEDVILDECLLERGEGDSGTLTFIGELAPEEDDDPVPTSTRLRLVWTPRSVPLERGHAVSLGSNFSYPLLQFWQRTEDFALKAAYKALVPVLYGTPPAAGAKASASSLMAAAQLEVVELDADTRAIAQRLAIGMDGYEAYYPVIHRVQTWRQDPPESALVKPGTQGDPPAFPPGVDLDGYKWICSGANVDQTGNRAWTTTNAWTGLPAGAKPDPAPDGWGTTPFDAKYYPVA